MRYSYQALDQSGTRIKGIIDVDNLEALRASMKSQGYYLIDAIKAGTETKLHRNKRLRVKELALFCRQMSAMLHAGVTLIRALDILYQQSESPKLNGILKVLYEDVQKGDMFSEALRKQSDIFPPLLVAMVESGEAGGILDGVMERLATQYESDAKLQSKIKGAMVYPCFVGAIAVLAVVGLIVFVLPTFISMYEGSSVELPALTSALIWLSNLIRSRWYIVVPAAIAMVFGISMFFSRPRLGLIIDFMADREHIFNNLPGRLPPGKSRL